MAVFEITVFKRSTYYPAPGDEWSNVYHCNSTDMANARIAAAAAVTAEQELYATGVEIFRYHIKEKDNPSAQSVTEYVSFAGTRTITSDPIPDWNVLRVDFNAPPADRPVRKYLRVTAVVDDVQGVNWNPDMITAWTAYADAISGQGEFCNPAGVLLVDGDYRLDTLVAMRQTGWSRRARPGFHRGYIPNA